jgi:2,3-bisphosphoglycerate-dependent phosphoglycerate mutase
MQLYFIRHGQSNNNAIMDDIERENYIFHREPDPDLTSSGYRQADLVAQYLAKGNGSDRFDSQNREGFGLTHLYCSLMVRSIETGLPISRKTGLPLQAWPEVHETGGIFEVEKQDGEAILIGTAGPGKSFFTSNFPELVIPEDLPEEGWWNREKEPRENYPKRAQGIVDKLLEIHGGTGDRVGIVTHGGIFAWILSVVFDVQAEKYWFLMNNCGISRIDISDEGRIMLAYMNKVDYLPDDLIT